MRCIDSNIEKQEIKHMLKNLEDEISHVVSLKVTYD